MQLLSFAFSRASCHCHFLFMCNPANLADRAVCSLLLLALRRWDATRCTAGGTLKDDADLAALGLKPGQNIMLMGSAEVLADKPAEATVFAEDMPEVEVAALQTDNPGGLTNLGNTCYLNSTLQCMKAIPELVTSLQKFSGGPASVVPGGATDDSIVVETKEIINELLRSNAAKEVKPFKYVSTFRTAFPMFAQRTDNGQGFVQQDAEECWSTLMSALSQKMVLSVDGAPSTDRTIFWESADMRVDQHSSASCWTKPWPLSVRCANIGNAVRNVLTYLNGFTSLAAFERSNSLIISLVSTTIESSVAPPGTTLAGPPENFWREVTSSGMAFMHCSVEFR